MAKKSKKHSAPPFRSAFDGAPAGSRRGRTGGSESPEASASLKERLSPELQSRLRSAAKQLEREAEERRQARQKELEEARREERRRRENDFEYLLANSKDQGSKFD